MNTNKDELISPEMKTHDDLNDVRFNLVGLGNDIAGNLDALKELGFSNQSGVVSYLAQARNAVLWALELLKQPVQQ